MSNAFWVTVCLISTACTFVYFIYHAAKEEARDRKSRTRAFLETIEIDDRL